MGTTRRFPSLIIESRKQKQEMNKALRLTISFKASFLRNQSFIKKNNFKIIKNLTIMTTQSIFRSFIALCIIVFGTQFSTAQTRELKEGEPIYLEVVNNPLINEVEVGNIVEFKTTSNVIVDGKEVVRAGSPAKGKIKRIERPGYNTTGQLQIEVEHIRAVDGQQVLVFSPINLSNWNIGTSTTVYVKNAIRIDTR